PLKFDLLILNLTRSDLHLTLLFRFHFRETRSLVVQFSKINLVLRVTVVSAATFIIYHSRSS
ncbi:hypothetical protein, partial [Paenibacillus woosongensis]|uniref:hypothetical protein n=1 Tax=Paenibacillus woosongensis TaxID=307580 RepID=UPI001E5DF05E